VQTIEKGWSDDKKYRLTTADGKQLLLRISAFAEHDRKQAEFNMMARAHEHGVCTAQPIEFGLCDDGQQVYQLCTWLPGEDVQAAMMHMSEPEQYAVGVKAGELLCQLHALPAPKDVEPWNSWFFGKVQDRLAFYQTHPIQSFGGDIVARFLQENKAWLNNRPQCLSHGDFNQTNLIVQPSGQVGVIDFNAYNKDHGDPWWEFDPVNWGGEVNAHYNSGLLNGYFAGKPPQEFFRLFAYYNAYCALAALCDSSQHHQGTPDEGRRHLENILGWHDDFTRVTPSWYLERAKHEQKLGSIHVLNIGWEDAIVLESDGHYALVDAGEPGRGAYIVDYLQRLTGNAAVHLDFIIGTHAHVDHMGGFPFLLNHPSITVGQAFAKHEPNPDLADEIDRGHYQNFLTGCASRGVEVTQHGLDNIVLILGNMTVTLLNGAPLTGCSTNQDSLCQLVQAGGFKALLAADMTGAANELAMCQQINSTIDLLKIGHHGMGDSTGRAFVKKLRPSVAVYTNGNSWQTESHDVTLGVKKGLSGYRNLQKVGTAQYVTTDNGGIVAVIGDDGVEYYAIKEFTKNGDVSIYERREEIVLRQITPP